MSSRRAPSTAGFHATEQRVAWLASSVQATDSEGPAVGFAIALIGALATSRSLDRGKPSAVLPLGALVLVEVRCR